MTDTCENTGSALNAANLERLGYCKFEEQATGAVTAPLTLNQTWQNSVLDSGKLPNAGGQVTIDPKSGHVVGTVENTSIGNNSVATTQIGTMDLNR